MDITSRRGARRGAAVCGLGCWGLVAACLSAPAHAGNEANFVLYSHHTEEQGVTEINGFGDFSTSFKDEPRYKAYLFEIEHAFTDRFMGAFYLEGDRIQGEDANKFGSFRAEARYRLFDYGAFLNPVLYVEYEHLTTSHRYKLDVLGREDTPGVEETENSIESKLILGHDFTDRLDAGFNWINEVNLGTGRWEFGYALGLNYKLFEDEGGGKDGKGGARDARRGDWSVKEVKVGFELYGGLGDATLGLTMDPQVTQQFAGLNLKAELQNGFNVMMGGAVGLTGESDHGVFRVKVGYEFE